LPEVASPITASYGKQIDSSDTSKGPPNLIIAPPLTSNPCGDHESREGLLVLAHGQGNAEIGKDIGTTLNCNHEAPIVFDPNQVTSPGNYSNPKAGDPCHPLVSAAPPLMAFGWNKSESQTMRVGDTTDALQGSPTSNPAVAVAFQEAQTGCREYPEAGALRANGPGHDPVGTRIRLGMSVRRLLPVECEKLQGYEPGYTAIVYKNKPAADGPRYKAIGNSMAVSVLEYILQRIETMA
jgi:DNA (cytosine-5)-methyltransferase 1